MQIPLATHESQTAFVANGVTYVPHYQTSTLYVGPGYHPKDNPKLYTVTELKLAGAKEQTLFLWPRPKFKHPTLK